MSDPQAQLAGLIESLVAAVGARAGGFFRWTSSGDSARLSPLEVAGSEGGLLEGASFNLATVLPAIKRAGTGVLLPAGDPRWGNLEPAAALAVASFGGGAFAGVEMEGHENLVLGLFGSKTGSSVDARQMGALCALLSKTTAPAGGSDADEIQRLLAQRTAEQQIQAEFLAGLGHELKTPLNAIIGFSSLLEKQLHDEELLEEVEMISLSAEKLVALIDDLIDSYKIQAGKLTLHKDLASINEVIGNAVETIRVIADDRNIRVRAYLDGNIPEFEFDSKRIQQVLNNLLGNAVKFVPAGGEIIVRSNWESENVRVQVADTGEGIPPEVLPSIFQRFKQAEGSEARDARSAGLGLALCKDFVEMHGGTIAVTSETRKGSIFTFILPMEAAGEAAKAQA